MATSLGDFHTMVADALGRSTSLDSVIPKRVDMAARWLERNYTFQYMRTWKELNVLTTATYPYILSLYDMEIKDIEVLRRRTTDSSGTVVFSRPLIKVKPQDRESRPSGQPESFWLNGVSSIILNSTPDENMTLEGHLVLFTKWGSASNWTHWLLDNATELLLCRTLMYMAIRTRDPDLYRMYEDDLAKEIQSFNVSEEALQHNDIIPIWEPLEFSQLDDSLRSM